MKMIINDRRCRYQRFKLKLFLNEKLAKFKKIKGDASFRNFIEKKKKSIQL